MRRKNSLIVIGVMVALGGLATGLLMQATPDAPPDNSPVLLPEQAAAEPLVTTTFPNDVATELRPSGIAPEIELEILRDAGDPAAKLRGVKLAGDRQQIACGEMMATNARKYARFIWLADASKVIADDGRSGFAQVAPLCDGKGLP